MGRGRAKAKQVKVARQLKYNGGGTDLNRLREELGVGTEARSADPDSPYAAYDGEDVDEDALDDDDGEEDDDEDDWSSSRLAQRNAITAAAGHLVPAAAFAAHHGVGGVGA
jgi:Protein of unknown function (DUF3073)